MPIHQSFPLPVTLLLPLRKQLLKTLPRERRLTMKRCYRRPTRRRTDAMMLMAEAFLRDSKVASTTDDRYQVVVHVDSAVLAKNNFAKPSGEPDC